LDYFNAHTHLSNTSTSIYNLIVGKDNSTSGFFSAGIHPWHISAPEVQFQILSELATEPKCLAIGECGLDKLCSSPFGQQMEVFKKQIELAEKLEKPLIIHCVKAFDELLKIKKSSKTGVPWVIHGFNQKNEMAKQLQAQGFYFSLGKALLNPESNSSKWLNHLPINRLFLETDDAEISIEQIYKVAASTLNLAESELVSNLQLNCKSVFGIVI
jgi:TatD DNase family protein